MTRIAILGTGNVGRALAKGLAKKHEIKFGSRNPAHEKAVEGSPLLAYRDAVKWAEVVILAIPYTSVKETANSIGPSSFKGKVLVDVTNPLSPNMDLAVGFNTSAAEELSKLVPEAKVVKAFNYVFAANMSTGKINGEPLTLFVAGDATDAKSKVMQLGSDIGFEPIDAGPLICARYLEPLAMQLIKMGYGLKMGTNIGFRLVH